MLQQQFTELWQADSCLQKCPEFIDPHITIEVDKNDKQTFLFELNPLHKYVLQCSCLGETREKLLTRYGFINPKLLYAGEVPQSLGVRKLFEHRR